jgi:hypothetical protein
MPTATKQKYSIKKDMDGVFNRNAIQCCDVNAVLQALGLYFEGKQIKLNILMCDAEKIAKYFYTTEEGRFLDAIIGWNGHWSNGIFITQKRVDEHKEPWFDSYDDTITWIVCRRTDATRCHGINCEWVEISLADTKKLYRKHFPKL